MEVMTSNPLLLSKDSFKDSSLSFFTISSIIPSKEILGTHPNFLYAFDASPNNSST